MDRNTSVLGDAGLGGVGGRNVYDGTLAPTGAQGIQADVIAQTSSSVSASAASATEGDTGTTVLSFAVTLSGPTAATVTVTYSTQDGTAQAGSDYTAASGTLTFAPGEVTKVVNVLVIGDVVDEPDETLSLALSNPVNAEVGASGIGTITDDDGAPSVSVIASARIPEANVGTAFLEFPVTLSRPSAATITVNYVTTDGTATAGSDYAAAVGTLTFAPGEVTKAVSVGVMGDAIVEPDETFSVTLSNPMNATIADATAVGTILDDDTSEVDFCNVQFPGSLEVSTGASTELIFGQIYEAGVTELDGASSEVFAQVGWGPLASDPGRSEWSWFPAVWNMQAGPSLHNDEYRGSFTAPAPGQYSYAYRFSLDDGLSWTYCDANGAGANAGLTFDAADLPVMTVAP
jgi:hypothetical protein